MIYINESWDDGYCHGNGVIHVFSDGVHTLFIVKDFDIVQEENSTDCEDHNDVCRWMLKSLLTIRQKEYADSSFHCDWSAETNGWRFRVEITR